jgi:AcrR family transcriptional regulator
METVAFDKITVRAITEKAMINRSTFYLHYMDKFELIRTLENGMLEEIKSIFVKIPINVFVNKTLNIEEINTLLTEAYQHIKENSRFFLLMMSKKGNPSFFQKLSDAVKEVVQSNIPLASNWGIPEKYLVAIVSEAQTSIIKEWLGSKMEESPEELAEIVSNSIMYFVEGANIYN